MRLDFWVTSAFNSGEPVTDEAMAFTNGRKKIFLVESQQEYDLVYALQFIYGGEVTIQILPHASWQDIQFIKGKYPLVYTTWDPFDRNRI